jgi:hypothetical protein
MTDRKKRSLTQVEKGALASAGLTVTRYNAGGERAVVTQLAPESDERRLWFVIEIAGSEAEGEGL